MNQNARDAEAAVFPAINWPILSLCNEYNVGLLQMPCPEIGFLDSERNGNQGNQLEKHSIPMKAALVEERSV
ncbi:MAG: hypothetical protein WC856_24705 [Methylococcaceae bacterium]|jgi:predicted secreted protein